MLGGYFRIYMAGKFCRGIKKSLQGELLACRHIFKPRAKNDLPMIF